MHQRILKSCSNPDGEEDSAEILMASGQWIKIWKVINEEEEILLWSLKNVPGNQKLILFYYTQNLSRLLVMTS